MTSASDAEAIDRDTHAHMPVHVPLRGSHTRRAWLAWHTLPLSLRIHPEELLPADWRHTLKSGLTTPIPSVGRCRPRMWICQIHRPNVMGRLQKTIR